MAVLSTKNVSYQLTIVEPSVDNKSTKSQLAPLGTVPILKDDGLTIFDSIAINEYLDDVYSPKMHPGDLRRLAINRSWIQQSGRCIKGILALGLSNTRVEYEAQVSSLTQLVKPIENALLGSYFNGGELAIVDASFMPFLSRHAALTAFLGFDPLNFSDRLLEWRNSVNRSYSTCSELHLKHGELFLNYLLDKNPHINNLRDEGILAADLFRFGIL